MLAIFCCTTELVGLEVNDKSSEVEKSNAAELLALVESITKQEGRVFAQVRMERQISDRVAAIKTRAATARGRDRHTDRGT